MDHLNNTTSSNSHNRQIDSHQMQARLYDGCETAIAMLNA
jgi:hypothetical protein